MEENKINNVDVSVDKADRKEQILSKNEKQNIQGNIPSYNDSKEKEILKDDNKVKDYKTIQDFLEFGINLKEEETQTNNILEKVNVNLNIEGLNTTSENIKNYFQKILDNYSFNEYYNTECIKEERNVYEFKYYNKDNLYNNVILSNLNNDRLEDAISRNTNISSNNDNTSWRPNFVNFLFTNYQGPYNYSTTVMANVLPEMNINARTDYPVNEKEAETMQAWNQIQGNIATETANVNLLGYNDFLLTTRIRTCGRNQAPIYSIKVDPLLTGTFAIPTEQYTAASTLNKQFLQSNEMFKNTRLNLSQVCNSIDYNAIQLIFGSTQNVGLNYTNKTELTKLLLYCLMYNDYSEEYLRNYNSNNLSQIIAQKNIYHEFTNENGTYYTHNVLKVKWCSLRQYYNRVLGLQEEENKFVNTCFIPVTLQQLNQLYILFSLISTLPYPIISKHLLACFYFAFKYTGGRFSYNRNFRMADYLLNYINIDGFDQICYVIVNSTNNSDNPASQEYIHINFRQFYNIQNIQILNYFNEDQLDEGYHELTIDNIREIMIQDNFSANYYGNMINYVINIEKWEFDASILEFITLITTCFKCNYQKMDTYDFHEVNIGNESIINYNFDNETWPITPNGLIYQAANSQIPFENSVMYYCNFKSKLSVFLGLAKLMRPKTTLNLRASNINEFKDMIYLIRLKSTTDMNIFLKQINIPTMPDNTIQPTGSALSTILETSINNLQYKLNTNSKNYISYTARGNEKETYTNHFYSYKKLNTNLNSNVAEQIFQRGYEYIYSTTHRWLRNYFNRDEYPVTTLKENRTLDINKLHNNLFDFNKVNTQNNNRVNALIPSINKYSKDMNQVLTDNLNNYIGNCFSLVTTQSNSTLKNPQIMIRNKIQVTQYNSYTDGIFLPMISMTPLTCYTLIGKDIWILSTIGTDYQIIFNDISFCMYNFSEKINLSYLFRCNNLSFLLPHFDTLRLLSHNIIQTIDGEQEPDLDQFIFK